MGCSACSKQAGTMHTALHRWKAATSGVEHPCWGGEGVPLCTREGWRLPCGICAWGLTHRVQRVWGSLLREYGAAGWEVWGR